MNLRSLVKYLAPPAVILCGGMWVWTLTAKLLRQDSDAAVILGVVVGVTGIVLFLAGVNWYVVKVLGLKNISDDPEGADESNNTNGRNDK